MNYSSFIAKQVSSIQRSGIRDFFELVQGREGVISLGVGEPDFATPWHIREAAIYALEKGQTSYTSNLGLLELRKLIASYVENFFGVSYEQSSEVLVTVGVSEAIDLALRALLNPGDEVIYHEPCYVSYSPSIAMSHGKAVAITTHKEDGFSLKASALEQAITSKTKILMLNFPTNPTGAVASREDLADIAKLCVKHDLIVLTDEIYSELSYSENEHVSIASFPGMKERTLLLHGFSKAFSMTGFRVGYVCAPSAFIEAMMKVHQYAILCASTPSQFAAIEALRHGAEAVESMRQSYRQRRDIMVRRFNQMGIACASPGGAFYAFPQISKFGLSSKDFAMKLLDSTGVAAVPGSAFGPSGEGFLRCCYATSLSDMQLALDRIEQFVLSLDEKE